MRQKQYRLAKSLFETRTEFADDTFYDVSAWTLPLAFDLRFAGIERSLSTAALGDELRQLPKANGRVTGGSDPYAYVIDWKQHNAPRALYGILAAGLKTRVSNKPFTAVTAEGNREFATGTIVVPVGLHTGRAESLHAQLKDIAMDAQITIHAVDTGD